MDEVQAALHSALCLKFLLLQQHWPDKLVYCLTLA